ncbi:MAG TPA: hypothetical protein VKG92_02300, partial [Flavobacteriales bacterium]|nr:hypothetical protein [Flavobacteriales bacterium]
MVASAPFAHAQLTVTTPVNLTGPQGERAVDSLAYPSDATSLVTVEGAVRAGWLWATAQVQGTSIELVVLPAVASYRDGLLLRFQAPMD